MTHSRHRTVVLLAGTLVLAGGGCGGGSSKATNTGTTVTGPAGTSKKRPSLASTPAKTLKFTGTGPKELGVVRIPTDSTLKWTNDMRVFQIIPASIHVRSPVNSHDHSGEAKIKKGAYHGFLVNADGKWTLQIVPGG